VLFVSVYIGDFLVLTDERDVIWHSDFNCTNSTKHTCHECRPGSFANQSMCIVYSVLVAVFGIGLLLKHCNPFYKMYIH